MLYLVTNEENKTFNNVLWGENVSHEEENPNHYFPVYNSPQIASYMYPFYEIIKNPKIWSASSECPIQNHIRSHLPKLTTIEDIKFSFPSNSQRMNFSILCSLNIVTNQLFKTWAINYLKGNKTKEAAQNLNEQLIQEKDVSQEDSYLACTYSLVSAVTIEDPIFLTACSAHRAYCDALTMKNPINLNQIIDIVNNLSDQEIVSVLE